MFRYENKGYNQTVSCKHPESNNSISAARFGWTCVLVQFNDAVQGPNGHFSALFSVCLFL